MTLCVIPARGGSKRIPRKNVKPFHGNPMITWSIAAAQASGVFDHIIVSTDDEEIAQVSREAGAEVPFIRPPELSDDHTATVPVIAHALREIEKLWGQQDTLCCLYATAPFVQGADITGVRDILLADNATQFAMPVTSFAFPIQRGVRLKGTGRIEMFQPEHALTRSQDLEEAYPDVGQFYWGRRSAWLGDDPIIGPKTAAFVIPRHRAQDIDTPEDWDLAERLFTALTAG